MQAIGDAAPWTEVRDADLTFHRALVDALGSPRTSRTYGALMTELRVCFLHLQEELEDRLAVAGQHAEILEAIEAGDAVAATGLLGAHLPEVPRPHRGRLPAAGGGAHRLRRGHPRRGLAARGPRLPAGRREPGARRSAAVEHRLTERVRRPRRSSVTLGVIIARPRDPWPAPRPARRQAGSPGGLPVRVPSSVLDQRPTSP